MSFGREKRMWLAALALLAPIPLPFNQVLGWPFLFVYALFVIHFLQRADRGLWITLPNWVLNLLALAAMPFIAADLRSSFLRGSVVTALAHLMMFLLVVKLYSIRREKDKWHVMVAIFFLFVGAMATSSHVTIAPYLLAFLVLGLAVLGRFAHLHVVAPFGGEESRAPSSFRLSLVLGTLLVVLLAVPLFAAMPRIREPYILGRGTSGAGMARTTGFSDSVDLSLTSSIRSNRDVAMRVQYDDETRLGNAADLRFKGAAYDRYNDRQWFRALRHAQVLIPRATASLSRLFELTAESKPLHPVAAVAAAGIPAPVNTAEIYLEPTGSSSLVLPVEALSLELDLQTTVGRDPGGAVLVPLLPRETLRYVVTLAEAPVIVAALEDDPDSPLSALDPDGLTPRMADLARRVMNGPGGDDGDASSADAGADAGPDGAAGGDGPAAGERPDAGGLTAGERIDRLEQYLLTQYRYTLDFLGRSGEEPLEDFLFVHRSGHCELFASAMVLMLRSQGIPARLVTGFLGAELNPIEGYYVVRQQNAHAWVEAYAPSRGWRIYDPTPPDGRPTVAPQSLSLLISQLYDYVTFRWDRYVLTYGADDQDSFFRRMRERMREMWRRLKDVVAKEPRESPADDFGADVAADSPPAPTPAWQPRAFLPVLAVIFALAAAAVVIWHRRRPPDGRIAYLRLRRRLVGSGLEVSDALAPLELLERAVDRFPSAAGALRHVVGRYVRESFAGRPLADDERRGLRDALRAVDDTLREQRRRRPRGAAPAAADPPRSGPLSTVRGRGSG